MNFSLQSPITKELILSRYSEEQIMEFYLKVRVEKKLFRSPLRQDKNPTCSFYRNKSGVLIFKDFATGQHLNCFQVVQEMFNVDYFGSLRIIANDFEIIKDKNIQKNKGKINQNPIKLEEKEMSKIQVEIQEFTELELKWWNKYGITLDILKKFNVYSCKHVFLNDQLFAQSQQHCPIFGYYGKKYHNMEMWKIYFPKRKEFRFIGNYPSGIMQCYDLLPKTGKLCIITKSQKDCMALYAYGIPACAPNSETVIPKEYIINDLSKRFKYLIFYWDRDYTGVTFLNKIRKQYPNFYYFINPPNTAKDFSDYREKFGYTKTKEFIIEQLKKLNVN